MGFDVVVNYSRSRAEASETVDLVRQLGVHSTAIECDVGSDQAVKAMFAEVAKQFGRLDVLVNNAAMTHFVPLPDLDSMEESMWDRILQVNLKGAFFCSRAAASLLRTSGDGAIVNISSVAGLTGRGSCIAYAASKGALNTMTKSLALALAPEIRVNAVLPGPIDSRWIREGNNDWDLAEMTQPFPIPRASQPDEIADGVVFFATGTKMTTGQLLSIDGGQTL
jgi:3-oxoacyl-[acyl-carrier protein] reductase